MTSKRRDRESPHLVDQDEEVREALFTAVSRGESDTVQKILKTNRSALINHCNSAGQPPLIVALAEGHGKVVEILVKNGADDSYADLSGNTPLHVVAGKGNYEALRVFLRCVKLPAPNAQNNDGDTALMHPASRGFSIIVECLLQHNADPNIPNKVGRTPIMAAAGKGHKEVIKVLLKHGADILLTSYEDYSGMPTALREAVASGSADVTAYVTQSCATAVERIKRLFTCKTGEEMSSLIKSGCCVNHRRGDGSTPLMIHAEVGNVDMVKCLLQGHVFMDGQDNKGETALMKSSFQGRFDVVREMVEKGALIDLKCRAGRSALMYSVLGGSLDVCKFLVQSGADATISDKSGATAQELAIQKDVYSYLQGRSTTKQTEMDPFTLKMSEYLKLQKKQLSSPSHELTLTTKASVSESSPRQRRRQETDRLSDRQESGQGGRGVPSQDDALKKELDKSIKRVAELETRVEELTIRAEFTVTDEEDLSYYRDQPERLIEEFRKMKIAKRKAEQFAIEAKQSAQKASVELSQVKEELLREKASNELKMKHMVSDVENRFVMKEQEQRISDERGRAYRGIIAALQNQRLCDVDIRHLAVQGIRFMEKPYSPEDVFNIIANHQSKTRFKVALVAVGGLPQSGKSALVKKLIPNAEGYSNSEQNGLKMFEVSYSATSHKRKWQEFNREDIYMFILTRALEVHGLVPKLKEWSELPTKCLSKKHLRDHFKTLYCRMHKGLEKLEIESDFHFHLMSEPQYVLLNVWDIGTNKALHEALPLIARLMHPMVLLNLINLHRDRGDNLRMSPELQDKSQAIMIGRSRGHYCIRIAGLSKYPGRCILIGTHKDKLVATEVLQVLKQTEAGLRAKASDVGADESLHSEMLAIDIFSEFDCNTVKRCLEGVVESINEFDHDLYLSWIFLRTALLHYKAEKSTFLISRDEFDALARECGVKSIEEIEKCLKFFTEKGSLLANARYFHDNVIYRPHIFFTKLNALYQAVDNGDEHAQKSLKVGILCRSVANVIWKEDTHFFWQLLQDAGVATPTTATGQGKDPHLHWDFHMTCPHTPCNEKELLFVSTLRKKRHSKQKGVDSLYVTFRGEYAPADIQRHFLKRLGIHIPGVKVRLTEYYNLTAFELPNNGGQIEIIVHGDVVELLTRNICKSSGLEITSVLKTNLVTVLDYVLKFFPGFEYQLALICKKCLDVSEDFPPNKNTTSYLHFLPSQCETELYCRNCKEMIKLREGQLQWMRAPLQGAPSSEGQYYEARLISKEELIELARDIPLDCYELIHPTLGRLRHSTISEEAVVGVLMGWQQESPCNRREKLAKILLRMGCYKAAIKLHPPLLNASVEEVQPHPGQSKLTDVEIERVCNCAVGWKKLAQALNTPADTVREIGNVRHYSERDRTRRLLQCVNGPGARGKVVAALVGMGWLTLAEALECGSISNYTARCTHFSIRSF